MPNEPQFVTTDSQMVSPYDRLGQATLSKNQELSPSSNSSLTTVGKASPDGIKQLKSKVITSQAAKDSGIKMLIFRSDHVSSTDSSDQTDLHTNADIIQEMKIKIQLREYWMKDLEKRLAASSSENACKESKITQQKTQLEEQNEMLVKRNEKIQFLEKQLSEVWKAADNADKASKQATEKIESSLHQIEVKTSQLETEIQIKDDLIQQLQTKVKELENEVEISKKFELECNDLAKKSTALGANISILKREIIRKNQANSRLEEDKKQLNMKMKQLKSRENEQVVKLHASLKEKVMELAKASEKIQVLENTINIMKDQQVSFCFLKNPCKY